MSRNPEIRGPVGEGAGLGKEPEPRPTRLAVLFSGQGNRPEDVVATYSFLKITAPEIVNHHLSLGQRAINLAYGSERKINLTEPLTDPSSSLYDNTAAVQMITHVLNLASYEAIKTQIGKPAATAGLSFGEMAALAAAGVWATPEQSYMAVALRGLYMDDVCKEFKSGHVRVQGLSPKVIKEIVVEVQDDSGFVPTIALKNAPGLYQVAIKESQREQLVAAVINRGGKTADDGTLGGFHSRLMEKARLRFEAFLCPLNVANPQIIVVSNNTGKESNSGKELVSNHIKGIISTVLWDESIKRLKDLGVDCFIICGPGGKSLPVLNRLNGVPRDQTQTFQQVLVA